MKTRVTITLDPSVHRRSRKLATAQGTTVSALIESLLLREANTSTGSVVDEMVGSASLRQPGPEKDARFDRLRAKYLS